jgi:hypothetical protein
VTLRFVYWILPALVFYTDRLPVGTAGAANGPVIRIRHKYGDPKGLHDEGLHQHELEHVKQWYFTLGLHPLFYWLWKPYRLGAEVRAYRVQMQHRNSWGGKLRIEEAAAYLSNSYKLNISVEEAIKELK